VDAVNAFLDQMNAVLSIIGFEIASVTTGSTHELALANKRNDELIQASCGFDKWEVDSVQAIFKAMGTHGGELSMEDLMAVLPVRGKRSSGSAGKLLVARLLDEGYLKGRGSVLVPGARAHADVRAAALEAGGGAVNIVKSQAARGEDEEEEEEEEEEATGEGGEARAEAAGRDDDDDDVRRRRKRGREDEEQEDVKPNLGLGSPVAVVSDPEEDEEEDDDDVKPAARSSKRPRR